MLSYGERMTLIVGIVILIAIAGLWFRIADYPNKERSTHNLIRQLTLDVELMDEKLGTMLFEFQQCMDTRR